MATLNTSNDYMRKDVPCGYPKIFRKITLMHNVNDVFHTADVYDKFIAVGNGLSYSKNFVNGSWTKVASGDWDNNGSRVFVSGCHLNSPDVDINVILSDDGSVSYSYDGETWYDGGNVCEENETASTPPYPSGWACICAGDEGILAVNSKYDNQYANNGGNEDSGDDANIYVPGVGAYGTWNVSTQSLEWTVVTLPFPSNNVKYFNGYFYIYGQVESTSGETSVSEFTSSTSSALKTAVDLTADIGSNTITINDTANSFLCDAEDISKIQHLEVYKQAGDGIYPVPLTATGTVSGSTLTITIADTIEESDVFMVKYSVVAKEFVFSFTPNIDGTVKNVIVTATTDEGVSANVYSSEFTVDESGVVNVTAVCYDKCDSIAGFNIYYYSLSANIANLCQAAISDTGINFDSIDDSFSVQELTICESAYGRGIYIALTGSGEAVFSTATPCLDWDFLDSLKSLNCEWTGIAFVCGMFVVCGTKGGVHVMYYSVDAKQWTEVEFKAVDPAYKNAETIAYPLRLIDCKGTLVATSLTPEANDTVSNTKGFFACDTYFAI